MVYAKYVYNQYMNVHYHDSYLANATEVEEEEFE